MALLLMSFLTPLFNIQPTKGETIEPALEWEKTFGGTEWDAGYSVQLTGDGGYIITGYTGASGFGGGDVYLVKTDSSGNLMWEKTLEGGYVGWSVQVTGDGGYIITGGTRSFGAGYTDVYLVKTDSNGTLMWEKTFGRATSDDIGRSIQVVDDSGYIIVGTTHSFGAGREDVYLVRVLFASPPEDQPPTCVIKLQKEGVEISEIDVGEFLDIYVGDSTDDTGIKQARFSSDDVQDGIPTGQWTQWYDWDSFLDDWDASTKIKRWAFATGGDKEVWAEVKDDIDQTDTSYTNVFVRARVSISVNPFGAFVETRVADTASLPLRVETSRGGQPVSGARVFTADGSLILGITDANGVVEATYPIAHPPTAEDFTISIMAEVNSITFSSDPITLYSSSWLGGGVYTLTENEAQWYSLFLLLKYAAQPGIPVPDPFWGLVLTMIDLLARLVYDLSVYEAQAGDDITYELYEYTSPGVETAYCYMEKVERSGQEIYNRIWWTNDYSLVEPYDVQDLQRAAIVGTLASPATLYITDPDGRHAGVDPSTGEEVFEFPVAMEEDNDGHLWLIIPAPLIGDYTFTIIGTGEGTYSLTLQTVDTTGYTMEEQVVSAAVAVGFTHDYSVAYSPDQVLPLTITLLATMDFDPDTVNLKSKGKWITAYIELPEGYDVVDIDVSTVELFEGDTHIFAEPHPTEIGDYDDDGLADLMVKFDRASVIGLISKDEDEVILTVLGKFTDGVIFTGEDTIKLAR